MRRINRLTTKGKIVAELAIRKKRALAETEVDKEELQEAKTWMGRDTKSPW